MAENSRLRQRIREFLERTGITDEHTAQRYLNKNGNNVHRAVTSYIDAGANSSGYSTDDGEPIVYAQNGAVRLSCELCSSSRRKCGEETPCNLCKKKNVKCIRPKKRKPGPVPCAPRNPKYSRGSDNTDRGFSETVRESSNSTSEHSVRRVVRSLPCTARDQSPSMFCLPLTSRQNNDNESIERYGSDASTFSTSIAESIIASMGNKFSRTDSSAKSLRTGAINLEKLRYDRELLMNKITLLQKVFENQTELISFDTYEIRSDDLQYAFEHISHGNSHIPILNSTIIEEVKIVLSNLGRRHDFVTSCHLALFWCACGLGASYLLSPRSFDYFESAVRILKDVDTHSNIPSDVLVQAYFGIEILLQNCSSLSNTGLGTSQDITYPYGTFRTIGENIYLQRKVPMSGATRVLYEHLRFSDAQASSAVYLRPELPSMAIQASPQEIFEIPIYVSRIMFEWYLLLFAPKDGQNVIGGKHFCELQRHCGFQNPCPIVDHQTKLVVDRLHLAALRGCYPDPMSYSMIQLSIILHLIFSNQPYLACLELSSLGDFLCHHVDVLYVRYVWPWCHLILRMLYQSKMPHSLLQSLAIGKHLLLQMPRLSRRRAELQDPVLSKCLKVDLSSRFELDSSMADSFKKGTSDILDKHRDREVSYSSTQNRPLIPSLSLAGVQNDFLCLDTLSYDTSARYFPEYDCLSNILNTIRSMNSHTSRESANLSDLIRGIHELPMLNQFGMGHQDQVLIQQQILASFHNNLKDVSHDANHSVASSEVMGDSSSVNINQDLSQMVNTSYPTSNKGPVTYGYQINKSPREEILNGISQRDLIGSDLLLQNHSFLIAACMRGDQSYKCDFLKLPRFMNLSPMDLRCYTNISFSRNICVSNMSLEHIAAALDLNRPFPWENDHAKRVHNRDKSFDGCVLFYDNQTPLFLHRINN